MKPIIAVIGIENEKGREIAGLFAKADCRLLLYSEDLQNADSYLSQLKQSAPDADAEVLECKVTASWEADIIIMAVPDEKITEIAAQIKDVVCQKIILAPDSVYIENLISQLPHCKVLTFGRNKLISGEDNEALDVIINILGKAA